MRTTHLSKRSATEIIGIQPAAFTFVASNGTGLIRTDVQFTSSREKESYTSLNPAFRGRFCVCPV